MDNIYQCTRCQRTVEGGNALMCERGPCPMELLTPTTTCTICAPGSNEKDSPGFYHGCMAADEGGVCNGWTCNGQGQLTHLTALEIPAGMMLVSAKWQPILDEIERRASKMDGLTDDFTVTIQAEDWQEICKL